MTTISISPCQPSIVRTVGELRALIAELPPETPIIIDGYGDMALGLVRDTIYGDGELVVMHQYID
jgi:hypothetical protein